MKKISKILVMIFTFKKAGISGCKGLFQWVWKARVSYSFTTGECCAYL